MNKSFREIVKKELVKFHGTDSCKRVAEAPSSEVYFCELRKSVERNYAKYKELLPEDEYLRFIDEIYDIYKEYKIRLDKSDEEEYGKIMGDSAEKIADVIREHGLEILPVS